MPRVRIAPPSELAESPKPKGDTFRCAAPVPRQEIWCPPAGPSSALGRLIEEGSERVRLAEPSSRWAIPSRTGLDVPVDAGVEVVVMDHSGRCFVGRVVRATRSWRRVTGVELALLGSGGTMKLSRSEVLRSDIPGPHRWADRKLVAERQRRGEPAHLVEDLSRPFLRRPRNRSTAAE